MGWEKKNKSAAHQTKLFREFSDEEKIIMDLFEEQNECGVDDIMVKSKLPASKLAALLLSLEFDGIITALPGKIYRRN